ncbi:MAG: hypothetical protein ICV84_24365 [Flavisolibacter sp.]|nr:hypothetical protein [Flavisolibacter sp.]
MCRRVPLPTHIVFSGDSSGKDNRQPSQHYRWTPKAISSTGTKPMNDKVFWDTNILVYAYSKTEVDKQIIARKLITEKNSFISTQVLQELCNTIT